MGDILFRRETYGVFVAIGALIGGFALKADITTSAAPDVAGGFVGRANAAVTARESGGISTLTKSKAAPIRLASAEPDLATDASPELAPRAPAIHFADRFLAAFPGAEAAAQEGTTGTLAPAPSNPVASAPPMGPAVAPSVAKPATAAAPHAAPAAGGSLADLDPHTAVYDISGHTVYLPNGETLEAHSGLGSEMDNPRYVDVRMKGPTPPNLYRLTFREAIFHGVRALRLTPIGDGKMHGRAGLLAHTYMLGPNGQSNGCVSFSNYQAFLRAFESGQVKQMMVVGHLTPTEVASLRHGHTDRMASAGDHAWSWWPFGRGAN